MIRLEWSSEDGMVIAIKVYADGKRERENTGISTSNPESFKRLKNSMEERLTA